jgi:hypothetical protein
MSGGVENFSQPIFHNQNQAEATLGISLHSSLPIDAWMITQLAVSALLAFLVYHILKYSRIKGPTVWPVLGTTPQFLWNLPRMHDWTTDMLKKYDGTYTSIAPKCTCLTAVATCRFLPLITPKLAFHLNTDSTLLYSSPLFIQIRACSVGLF